MASTWNPYTVEESFLKFKNSLLLNYTLSGSAKFLEKVADILELLVDRLVDYPDTYGASFYAGDGLSSLSFLFFRIGISVKRLCSSTFASTAEGLKEKFLRLNNIALTVLHKESDIDDFWSQDFSLKDCGSECSKNCFAASLHLAQICFDINNDSKEAPDVEEHKTFITGNIGNACILAVLGNDVHQIVLSVIKNCYDAAMEPYKLNSSELLYGQAGVLSALLFILKYNRNFSQLNVAEMARSLVYSIIQVGEQRRRDTKGLSKFPLLYDWEGETYLGAAHGVAGIYHILNIAVREIGIVDQPLNEKLSTCIDALIALQKPNGNFPVFCDSSTHEILQWCHGAPGIIPFICSRIGHEKGAIEKHKEAYLSASKKACDLIWKHGLLRKGVGLCHGISGNAYSFLYVHEAYCHTEPEMVDNGKHNQLARAAAFSHYSHYKLDSLINVPDYPLTLFGGVAGLACLDLDIALLLAHCKMEGFPGYC